jgi:hypothetical protein
MVEGEAEPQLAKRAADGEAGTAGNTGGEDERGVKRARSIAAAEGGLVDTSAVANGATGASVVTEAEATAASQVSLGLPLLSQLPVAHPVLLSYNASKKQRARAPFVIAACAQACEQR